MKALTVKDLAEYFNRELMKGRGDHVVFVTDDEEANGYHALWFSGECAEDMSKENRTYVENSNCDISIVKDNKDKAIYIG